MSKVKTMGASPLYSQEYVSALDDVAQYWIGQSAEWKERAEAADQRIAELERRLATPVRLPERYYVDCGVGPDPNGDWLSYSDVVAALCEQGFIVDGDA